MNIYEMDLIPQNMCTCALMHSNGCVLLELDFKFCLHSSSLGPGTMKLRTRSHFSTTYTFCRSETEIKSELVQDLWPPGLASFVAELVWTTPCSGHLVDLLTTPPPNLPFTLYLSECCAYFVLQIPWAPVTLGWTSTAILLQYAKQVGVRVFMNPMGLS